MEPRILKKNMMISKGIGAMVALVAGFSLIAAVPALADPNGDSNAGDVWVDNVGQPPGPGHEMDPHLACADINLWGDKLADASGTYTIDGWEPSGSGAGDQAWPGTAAHPGNAPWSYNGSLGGSQVISVIDVDTLIANAVANGDTPQAQQGYHFKLQFSQDPQKHKTFWVNCPAPETVTPPTPTPTPTGGQGAGTPTPTGGQGAGSPTPAGGVQGAGGTGAGGTEAASTVLPGLPAAGAGQQMDHTISTTLIAAGAVLGLLLLLAIPGLRRRLWRS